MEKIFIKIYRSVYLLFITISAFGQSTLDRYVELGMKNNQEFLRQQLETQIAEEEWKSARGKFMPDISFDASYIWAEGGRTIDVPSGDLVNPIYQGINELLGEERYPTNIPNTSEQFLPDNFHETKIRLVQPILNTTVYFNEKAKAAKVSAEKAREQALKNSLKKEIKTTYYRHLSLVEQVDIFTETRALLQDIVEVNEKLVRNDKATKEAVYYAEAELSTLESQLAAAVKQENTSRLFFNFLLNRDLETPITIDSIAVKRFSDYSLNELKMKALNQRSEISQVEFGLDANHQALKLNRSYRIPEINLVGDLGYQGFEYTFDENQEFWFIRLGLTWPIFQGGQNKSKIQQATLKSQQLESQLTELRQQIQLEVSNAFYSYQEAMAILESREAQLKSASENFRIVSAKYREGQALPIELREARTDFTTAQLAEVIARYNVLINKAELEASINLNIDGNEKN